MSTQCGNICFYFLFSLFFLSADTTIYNADLMADMEIAVMCWSAVSPNMIGPMLTWGWKSQKTGRVPALPLEKFPNMWKFLSPKRFVCIF